MKQFLVFAALITSIGMHASDTRGTSRPPSPTINTRIGSPTTRVGTPTFDTTMPATVPTPAPAAITPQVAPTPTTAQPDRWHMGPVYLLALIQQPRLNIGLASTHIGIGVIHTGLLRGMGTPYDNDSRVDSIARYTSTMFAGLSFKAHESGKNNQRNICAAVSVTTILGHAAYKKIEKDGCSVQ